MKAKPGQANKPATTKKTTLKAPKAEKEKMVRITLPLPDDLHNWLKAVSKTSKKSVSAIVRSILISKILQEMKNQPSLLEKGKTLKDCEQRWEKHIIPGFDLRTDKKPLIK